MFLDSQLGAYFTMQCNICFITCFNIQGKGVDRHEYLHPEKHKSTEHKVKYFINLHSIPLKKTVNTVSPLVGAET